jgi:hypothetical protein
MNLMKMPKAFISYAHESQAHKRWVLDLATRLRNVGVDASLDQWDLGPGDDVPRFMEQSLASADRVLMICTDAYVKKANAGTGGVGYEKMIVTADLLRNIDSNKVIPLIRQTGTRVVPTFLQTKLFIDFSSSDEFEFAFDNLTRAIHNAPLFVKPEISNNPFTAIASSPKKNGDPLRVLMEAVVRQFESLDEGLVEYSSLCRSWSGSRVMLDILLEQAKSEGLIMTSDGIPRSFPSWQGICGREQAY